MHCFSGPSLVFIFLDLFHACFALLLDRLFCLLLASLMLATGSIIEFSVSLASVESFYGSSC